MYASALQNSKLLTTSSGRVTSDWAVHFTTAPLCFYFWKTDLTETCLSPDALDGRRGGLALTAPGPPAPVTFHNWLQDFERCHPTAVEILAPEKS